MSQRVANVEVNRLRLEHQHLFVLGRGRVLAALLPEGDARREENR